MKILFLLSLISLLASPLNAREEINFNRNFKFQLGDIKNAQDPTFKDTNWAPASIPHSFSTPYWGENKFHVGTGWYRKNLLVPAEWINKKMFLDFEGVFQECDLYVNGKFIGRHQGGYTGFRFDISPAVKQGNNTIALRVNNLWNPELAPRAGEHVFSGGIYRDVTLVITEPLHVTWFGTFVKTPKVSKEIAQVELSTELKNDKNTPSQGTLITALIDPQGNTVALEKTPFTLKAGESQELHQTFPPIKKPKLWHPDSPQLYKAISRIMEGDKIADTYTTPFGIRSIKFTHDKGFFLNGEPFYIRGANVHQDRAGWGDAVVNQGFYRDVKMIKDSGLNFIRGSHYPHDPAFTEACDKIGVLFWSEGLFWGIGGFKPDGYWDSSAFPPDAKHHKAFEESLRNALRDMIRVHRNHPSVVTWSMGNEIFFTDKSVMNEAKECVTRLIQYSKELDPTRPAAIGGVQREGFDVIGDIAGYNGDGAYVKNPKLPSLVAEYGSVVSHRPGEYAPNRGCLQEERFPWRSGEVLWCGFHHGSIAGSMGRMGFIDYARLPLRAWYWYRNELLKQAPPQWPEQGEAKALTLTADKKTIRADGTDDTHLTISVVNNKGTRISASPPITLTVESGPGIFPTGKILTFEPDSDNAAVRDGWAAIEFRSYYAGKTKIKASAPSLKDATIEIICTDAPKFIPGKSPEWIPVAAEPTPPGSYDKVVECAQDRPAIASDTKTGSETKFANDNNLESAWEGTLDNTGKAWWRLDLENFYALHEIILSEIICDDFLIEITADEGKTWVPIGTKKTAKETNNTYTIFCDPLKAYGRFLRVTYTGKPNAPVKQGEINVKGISKAIQPSY